MADSMVAVKKGFRDLKSALKKASIEAIEREDFSGSRRLTETMEQLNTLELRAAGGFDKNEVPADAGAPGAGTKSYPRFYRIGDTLYKEGMRQDGQSIYTQKVGRQAFEEIATAVAGRKGRKFKPADVIGKVEQPSYQVYIVLNVLQDAGLVENPERGSYRVSKEAANTDVSALWGNIRTEAA